MPQKTKNKAKSPHNRRANPPGKWRNRIVGHGTEDPAKLIANPKNWRLHPKAQQDALAGVLREVGWVQDVIVNRRSGLVVDGHARINLALAAKERVPVVYVDLSDKEEALILASIDPLSAMAETNREALADLVGSLEVSDAAVNAMLQELVGPDAGTAGLTDPDACPEVRAEVVTVPGDLWVLGKHRLLCGDSTSADAVERLMAGEKADILFTDPPYGVSFERGKFVGREKAAKGPGFDPIENDSLEGKTLEDFVRDAMLCAFAVLKDAPIYVWSGSSPKLGEGGSVILRGITAAGFSLQSQLVWRKTPFVIGRADYHWQHEICWYGFKGANHPWYGGRDKGTVWDVPKLQRMENHPTEKPVALAEIAFENSTRSADLCLDLFGGSGSTLIACEKTARAARLMEIAPNYCDVILRRWQEFTGKDATLEADGRTFAEVAGARVPVVAAA